MPRIHLNCLRLTHILIVLFLALCLLTLSTIEETTTYYPALSLLARSPYPLLQASPKKAKRDSQSVGRVLINSVLTQLPLKDLFSIPTNYSRTQPAHSFFSPPDTELYHHSDPSQTSRDSSLLQHLNGSSWTSFSYNKAMQKFHLFVITPHLRPTPTTTKSSKTFLMQAFTMNAEGFYGEPDSVVHSPWELYLEERIDGVVDRLQESTDSNMIFILYHTTDIIRQHREYALRVYHIGERAETYSRQQNNVCLQKLRASQHEQTPQKQPSAGNSAQAEDSKGVSSGQQPPPGAEKEILQDQQEAENTVVGGESDTQSNMDEEQSEQTQSPLPSKDDMEQVEVVEQWEHEKRKSMEGDSTANEHSEDAESTDQHSDYTSSTNRDFSAAATDCGPYCFEVPIMGSLTAVSMEYDTCSQCLHYAREEDIRVFRSICFEYRDNNLPPVFWSESGPAEGNVQSEGTPYMLHPFVTEVPAEGVVNRILTLKSTGNGLALQSYLEKQDSLDSWDDVLNLIYEKLEQTGSQQSKTDTAQDQQHSVTGDDYNASPTTPQANAEDAGTQSQESSLQEKQCNSNDAHTDTCKTGTEKDIPQPTTTQPSPTEPTETESKPKSNEKQIDMETYAHIETLLNKYKPSKWKTGSVPASLLFGGNLEIPHVLNQVSKQTADRTLVVLSYFKQHVVVLDIPLLLNRTAKQKDSAIAIVNLPAPYSDISDSLTVLASLAGRDEEQGTGRIGGIETQKVFIHPNADMLCTTTPTKVYMLQKVTTIPEEEWVEDLETLSTPYLNEAIEEETTWTIQAEISLSVSNIQRVTDWIATPSVSFLPLNGFFVDNENGTFITVLWTNGVVSTHNVLDDQTDVLAILYSVIDFHAVVLVLIFVVAILIRRRRRQQQVSQQPAVPLT